MKIDRILKDEQNLSRNQGVRNHKGKEILFKEFSNLMDQIAAEMKELGSEAKISAPKKEVSSGEKHALKKEEKQAVRENRKEAKEEVKTEKREEKKAESAVENTPEKNKESEKSNKEVPSEERVDSSEDIANVEQKVSEQIEADGQSLDTPTVDGREIKTQATEKEQSIKSSATESDHAKDSMSPQKQGAEGSQEVAGKENAIEEGAIKLDGKMFKGAVAASVAEIKKELKNISTTAIEGMNFQSQTQTDKSQITASLIRRAVDGVIGVKEVGGSQNGNMSANAVGLGSSNKSQEGDVSKREVRLPKQLADRTLEKVENALKEVTKSKDGKTISIRLDPPSLGSVKVDVSLKEGALHARIAADSPQVTALLREKSHEVQQMLRKLGLEVDRVTVSVGGDTNSFSDNNSAKSNLEFMQAHKEVFGSSNSVAVGVESNITGAKSSIASDDHWIA